MLTGEGSKFFILEVHFMTHCFSGGGAEKDRKDILIYDSKTNAWTKTGDLCHGRYSHGISLVPESIADHCLFDIDC